MGRARAPWLLVGKAAAISAAKKHYEVGLQLIERVQSNIKSEYRFSYQDLQMQFFKDYVELLVSEGDTRTALQVVEYSRARVLAERLGKRTDAIDEVNPADFQRYAGQTGSVLLSYWLAPQRSFVWVIKAGSIRMRELHPASEIGELIRKYGNAIDEEQSDPVENNSLLAQQLATLILGPIRNDLGKARKVVIVPDGELHALNLETLPAPANPNRYWIEDDVEISIAPSLNVLRMSSETRPKNGARQSLLLIGAPVSASAEYPELHAAKLEIDGIHHNFPGAQVYQGSDATPRGFREAMPSRFSMIHFAAHAETNGRSPLESAVILSKNGNGGDGESYKLYAQDVARLQPQLTANLVTISACRSAGARAYGGEGLVGFAWAFLQSGARAVIAGLWDVDDNSSSLLMEKLYGYLASDVEPAKALHMAKLDLLHSGSRNHRPFYWAPYQIYIR